MRRDLIIGLMVSILFHVGFLKGSDFFKSAPPPREKTVKKTYVEAMEMPKIEEEPDPTTEITTDVASQVVEFAPPMQTDVPSLISVDSFVQKVQPPPPEGLKPNPGALTIPTNRPGTGATKLANVFDLKDLDQNPVARSQNPPTYPFEMKRAGVSGEVVVEFIVNVNGDVQDAFVRRSTQREFEAPALQAVSKWKFRPGKKGGKAVNVRMLVPIAFNINDE
jgi:protein TonB